MRITHKALGLWLLAVTAACNARNPHLAVGPKSAVALTGGMNTSMIYVARTDSGVIAIDLGWWGNRGPLSRALDRIDATPTDVKRVFITHSHRDHIAAWPAVQGARFHLADAERARLLGTAPHGGWMVQWAERLKDSHLPDSTQVDVRTFSRDTVFVLGSDTLRAFLVPGHTAGSSVYLFRGVLFMGDAVAYYPFRGYRTPKPHFTDDPPVAVASLKALWARVRIHDVRVMCTAHGECAPFTPDRLGKVGSAEPP
jgi:glyoxylase-like metal-dependent hydrolase (beta-lactamase superfamily II)